MTNCFEHLVALCIEKNVRIATCESITSGMFASFIADVPNASKVLAFGMVTYQTEAKNTLLQITDVIEEYGVISQECANAMVTSIGDFGISELGISFTGNAGPGVQDEKPVGQVYMAIQYMNKVYEYPLILTGSRRKIREQVCQIGCIEIINVLTGG